MSIDLEIGGIVLRIVDNTPGGVVGLPDGCHGFVVVGRGAATPAGILYIDDLQAARPVAAPIVAKGFNDLGESSLFYDGSTYTVGISPCPGEEMRLMTFSEGFREAHLEIGSTDPWSTFILDSMLRIFFSQVAVLESSFLIHASAVTSTNGAHLFMGCSGTGKSTHSSLWIDTLEGYHLLNDDNPLVRIDGEGRVTAHGTPWSGKTKCWKNESARLLSMTRLHQSGVNAYKHLNELEAFIASLPGVSVISHSRVLYDCACHTLGRVIERVRVGRLDCRPDADAARECRRNVEYN